MLKRFLSYYKPHIPLFTADMLASLGVAVITLIYPILTRAMVGDFIPNRNLRAVVFAGVGLMLVYLVRMLLNYFVQYKGHMMGVAIQARMRTELFAHLEALPFSFYDQNDTGKLMSRMTSDLFEISELAHHGPEVALTCTASVVASFVYLFSIEWRLTLILLICLPILLFVAVKMRGAMQKAFQARRAANAELSGALQSSLSGIRVTKAFTNAPKEQEKFEEGNKLFIHASRLAYLAMARFHSGTTFITDLFNAAVLLAGGIFLFQNAISFADYSAFILSVNLFLTPLLTLIRWTEDFQNGAAGFERFCEIMDTPVEADAPGAKDAGRLRGAIDFQNVSCSYGEGREILHEVNLHLPPGRTYALVGPSGGGKTTICHLIPHFYEIASGILSIDGQDIRTLTRASLRRNIGIVQQDVYLFNASIRDNILYGRLDATQAEVEEAARRANIHEDILAMPEGYDTVIGERGVRLSGGQKQRLCIARTLLKHPKVLIFDDSTSAVDTATEGKIRHALAALTDVTKLIIAQRITSVMDADMIVILDDGKVHAVGTHKELLANDTIYQEIYASQMKGDDADGKGIQR